MLFALHRQLPTAATLLFCLITAPDNVYAAVTTSSKPTSTSSMGICEFRTINYITDSLPQLCLKSSWSSANATLSTNSSATGDQTDGPVPTASGSDDIQDATYGVTASESIPRETIVNSDPILSSNLVPESSVAASASTADIGNGELNEGSFLSFEEWKRQTLENAGQNIVPLGDRKLHAGIEATRRNSDTVQNNLESLGEEGEIDLGFDAFRTSTKGEDTSQATEIESDGTRPDLRADNEAPRSSDPYRSKDAGKTCKERFSYASFDAGATVLKTHPGAKNSKAVLIENKDSYMLSECAADNKFLIVELSEDIWIDTLVLANYEFFSSMIRTFRVSVSDRYPVKIDRWKDLGTYEARNSREIQAFLIENPQIWARYLRIEFLSHYGNEYYCPLSLVRVHGTRMLESWKETEARGDEEDVGNDEQAGFVPDAVADVIQEEERIAAERRDVQDGAAGTVTAAGSITSDQLHSDLWTSPVANVNHTFEPALAREMTTPWDQTLLYFTESYNPKQEDICLQEDAPDHLGSTTIGPPDSHTHDTTTGPAHSSDNDLDLTGRISVSASPTAVAALSQERVTAEMAGAQGSLPITIGAPNMTQPVSNESASSSVPPLNKSPETTSANKNKTTSTSTGSAASPTIQESFFKSVSRRLHLLETNSTLSLKYIEEQSRILREAFSKVEKKQLQKTSSFLENLNSTVLEELRGFRQQYDEIWQSTVISLETQREESRREILAISARLNILADEVVFQKRMSIVQSVLLLLCLGLVIFSRVSAGGHLDPPSVQSRARDRTRFQEDSPLGTPRGVPDLIRTGSRSGDSKRRGSEHRRYIYGEAATSSSRSREDLPLTPISPYLSPGDSATPPSGSEDIQVEARPDTVDSAEPLDPTSRPETPDKASVSWVAMSDIPDNMFRSSSPSKTHKKKKAFVRQMDDARFNGAYDNDFDTVEESAGERRPESSDSDLRSGISQPDHERIDIADRSRLLPSPPAQKYKPLNIARKPLPAVPRDGQ